MKQLIMEPTYKKSVLEYQVWTKEIDGHQVRAVLEIGWRWGSFYINIPETIEEAIAWANERVGDPNYYKTIEEVYNDYSGGCNDFNVLTQSFCPSEEYEYIELDDYDTEMIDCWDGCWEEWTVHVPHNSELDSDSIREEVEEGWQEESWDWMQENGWEEQDGYFDICCNPKFSEVDENGNAIVTDEEVEA